jgi:hypothetical protein
LEELAARGLLRLKFHKTARCDALA